MISINAICIGYRIRDFLKEVTEGEVYCVHKNSFYCLLPHKQLLLVCDRGYGGIPFAISVDSWSGCFNNIGIEKGMYINFKDWCLNIPEADLCIYMNNTKVWCPKNNNLQFTLLPDTYSNLDFATQIGIAGGSKEGLGGLLSVHNNLFLDEKKEVTDLNFLCQLCFGLLCSFIRGIEKRDFYRVQISLSKLIGLGVGLTPSTDDLLIGLISSLNFLQSSCSFSSWCAPFIGRMLYSLCIGKTTLVSETFIKYASKGDKYEILENVIFAILFSSKEQLGLKIRKILSVGCTSGTEILLGILIGLRLGFRNIVCRTY